MSASSDSEDYSSRVLSKNKKNDENFMSCKNNFIKDFQNRSHISNVVQTSFSKANESFVNDSPKRKREHLDESEHYLNSSQTNKKKKVHHTNEEDVVENEHHDFVTVRGDHKDKLKKKNLTFADADELEGSNLPIKFESEGSKKHKKKKMLSLSDELNLLEVEEQAVPHKKHKKSKKQSKIESESSVYQPLEVHLHTPISGKEKLSKRDSIITSTQVAKRSLPHQDLNESKQSLLDFEQKNLSIQNIGNEVSEDELEIEELIEEAKLHLQSPKKRSKKVRSESENSAKTVDDPAHILKTFEKNNLSLKKANFESDSLHNLKESRSCFILKVPVNLDPNQLLGTNISLDKKKRIKIGASDYVTVPRESELSLVVFGENKRHLRFEVSRVVTMKPNYKADVLATKETEILNDLISKQVISVSSSNENEEQAKLEKAPTKNIKNNVDELDRFLKSGAKFLDDMKLVSIKFKNEKLIVDLEKQTNLVLQRQVEFLQAQNTSTAEYKKMKKELEKQTRELLRKRVNIMKSKKGGSDGELSDYF